MNELVKKAENYIITNGTTLQKACLNFIKSDSGKEDAIKELSKYQNEDGGWANGLEFEYQGNVSSPFTTAVALNLMLKFGLKDTILYQETYMYLKNTQKENGMWDDVKEMLKFEIPGYMGPGIYPEYKTGMVLKGLLKLNENDREMIDSAINYLLVNFDEISKRNDFWSAIAYSSAFAVLPHIDESKKIMGWALGILMPNTEEFSLTQVIGMIDDDIPLPNQAKDIAIKMLVSGQESDGGWPHKFGTYNRVWSAIYILRYLKNIKVIY
ncbi:terpene cyclase/mutase family protein [Clostridiaceae bacterium M8S5]|nr:terpene cyclase/mutase family protein [Clostridiaceae bacterium M8S5]